MYIWPDVRDQICLSGRNSSKDRYKIRDTENIHQQNLKNLLGLSALLGTFSIVGKTNRGNKYYKFDKLTIYSGIYYIKYFKNSRLWWSMQRYTEYAQNT